MSTRRPTTARTPRFALPALTPVRSAAERAADVIRDHIYNGEFAPGTQLIESDMAGALHVSRSTVRDAFRTLVHERLLDYEQHRGMFVRSLTAADVHDIFRLRRSLELAALDTLAEQAEAADLTGLQGAVAAGERALAARRWQDVGTANLHVHAQIVAVQGSPRADRFFRQLLTELRLAFLAYDAETLHRPFVARNRRILDLITEHDFDGARQELEDYLGASERQISAGLVDR